jgi:hypothetical protein
MFLKEFMQILLPTLCQISIYHVYVKFQVIIYMNIIGLVNSVRKIVIVLKSYERYLYSNFKKCVLRNEVEKINDQT